MMPKSLWQNSDAHDVFEDSETISGPFGFFCSLCKKILSPKTLPQTRCRRSRSGVTDKTFSQTAGINKDRDRAAAGG